jgi:hypothetical protein
MDTNLVMNRQIAYVKSLLMDMKAQLPEGVDDDTFVVKKKRSGGLKISRSGGREKMAPPVMVTNVRCGRLVGTSPNVVGLWGLRPGISDEMGQSFIDMGLLVLTSVRALNVPIQELS